MPNVPDYTAPVKVIGQTGLTADLNAAYGQIAGITTWVNQTDALIRYAPAGYRNILVGHPNAVNGNTFGFSSSYNVVENSNGNTLNAGNGRIIGGSGNTINTSGVTLINCTDFTEPGVVGAVYISNALAGSAAFTPINENEFGEHPAFTSQHTLNAYLLGGTPPTNEGIRWDDAQGSDSIESFSVTAS